MVVLVLIIIVEAVVFIHGVVTLAAALAATSINMAVVVRVHVHMLLLLLLREIRLLLKARMRLLQRVLILTGLRLSTRRIINKNLLSLRLQLLLEGAQIVACAASSFINGGRIAIEMSIIDS